MQNVRQQSVERHFFTAISRRSALELHNETGPRGGDIHLAGMCPVASHASDA
jgi:hypothetical protein